MTDGFRNLDYCVIKQEYDPLEWCVPMMPCSSKIGLPCFPCDWANNYNIFQCNESFNQLGMKAYEVEEYTSFIDRVLCCPSNRALELNFLDFYGNSSIQVQKKRKIPFLNTQQIYVSEDNK